MVDSTSYPGDIKFCQKMYLIAFSEVFLVLKKPLQSPTPLKGKICNHLYDTISSTRIMKKKIENNELKKNDERFNYSLPRMSIRAPVCAVSGSLVTIYEEKSPFCFTIYILVYWLEKHCISLSCFTNITHLVGD